MLFSDSDYFLKNYKTNLKAIILTYTMLQTISAQCYQEQCIVGMPGLPMCKNLSAIPDSLVLHGKVVVKQGKLKLYDVVKTLDTYKRIKQ